MGDYNEEDEISRETWVVTALDLKIRRNPVHTITVEVSLPEELVERFDARVQQHGGDQAEYVREIIERDLRTEPTQREMTFREIFAPSREGFLATGISDEALSDVVEAEVKAYRAERRARERQSG